MRSCRFFFLRCVCLLLCVHLKADEADSLNIPEGKEAPWTGLVRVKGLESLDKLLAIAFDQKSRSCLLQEKLPRAEFKNSNAEMQLFSKQFGYFSPIHPLVGKVTSEEQDILITQKLLLLIHQNIKNLEEHRLATIETLTKVLAYRDLKEGSEIFIPMMNEKESSELICYTVNQVFDLWHGMPAFGLIPKKLSGGVPILLFRGTDLSLSTERGWASVFSDLNTEGPGLSVFENAQQHIHAWLERAALSGQKAQVMGFSLGGVLAIYTAMYEIEWVNSDEKYACIAFNPPGVSMQTLDKFSKMSDHRKIPISLYISRGDLVSKIGFLVGSVKEFSVKRFLRPIYAHTLLMCTQPIYFLSTVDVNAENQSRGL